MAQIDQAEMPRLDRKDGGRALLMLDVRKQELTNGSASGVRSDSGDVHSWTEQVNLSRRQMWRTCIVVAATWWAAARLAVNLPHPALDKLPIIFGMQY